jgi:interferon-induced transmembrane protein
MTDQPPPPPGNYPPPPPPSGGYPPPPPQGGGYPPPQYGGFGQGAPPDNNLVWAILSTVLCCLPLGVVAIVKSTQVSGLWAQGRFDDAQRAADDAKKFAMWGAIAGVVVAVIWVIIAVSGAFAGMSGY